jgi:hypothetical protein
VRKKAARTGTAAAGKQIKKKTQPSPNQRHARATSRTRTTKKQPQYAGV